MCICVSVGILFVDGFLKIVFDVVYLSVVYLFV